MGSKKPPTPKPPKPWDQIPRPPKGDVTADITYTAVGRALSSWEYFESEFSKLFIRFLGLNSDNLPAIRAYGSVLAFQGRMAMVERAAEAFFFAKPSNELKAAVGNIIEQARGYSARRNEIAHGVVRKIEDPGPLIKGPFGGTMRLPVLWGFGVVPSEYATNKNDLAPALTLLHDITRVRKYTYASDAIITYSAGFTALGAETYLLSKTLFERDLRGA